MMQLHNAVRALDYRRRWPLHHQNSIITEVEKEACHRGNGIRIVLRDAALVSRWHPVKHSSA